MATTKKSAKAQATGKGKASKAEGKKGDAKAAAEPKRKLGLRGAAPWAARHAAKHAAEARARAAEPPPPGSARLTLRTPDGAEDIKAKIKDLHNAATQVKAFRKNLTKNFFEIGVILHDIRERQLYIAKGFGSFEAYLEREMADIGKTQCLRLVRVTLTFQKGAALELGLDRVSEALRAIEAFDGAPADRPSGRIPPAPLSSSILLPLKPPGR